MDQQQLVKVIPKNGTDSFDIKLDFDFTERVYTLNFFSVFDIMTIIGGFNASLIPFIDLVLPLFVLYFMFQLSEIIRDKMKSDYEVQLRRMIPISREQFLRLQEAIANKELNFNHQVVHHNRLVIQLLMGIEEEKETLAVIRGIKKVIIRHMKILYTNKATLASDLKTELKKSKLQQLIEDRMTDLANIELEDYRNN